MIVARNPEVVRNVRAQLRADRMVAAAAICLALCAVAGLAQSAGFRAGDAAGWGRGYLSLVVWAQAVVLVLGGALSALHAVQREKELNTFDYQRITRLAPLDLAVGKLLGAPALMYFIALCLLPAAVVGAAAAQASPASVLAGYAILLLGALAVHAFALLLSLLVERGVGLLAGVIVLLALWILPLLSVAGGQTLALISVSPFAAIDVMMRGTAGEPGPGFPGMMNAGRRPFTDLAFGHPVSHVPVLFILQAGFGAWFLLAVARNIKRDPALYQLYTPGQALGFALWINLILLAFFRWSRFTPLDAVNAFLAPNVVLFFALGITLLRNRDAVRRLRALGMDARRWTAAAWPAPWIGAGLFAAGVVPVAAAAGLPAFSVLGGGVDQSDWSVGLAVFRAAFVAAWVVRDLLFLQWIMLRRGSRPLRRGLQYLAVYYVCCGILLSAFHGWALEAHVGLATSAVFVPPAVMSLSPDAWGARWGLWLVALLIEVSAAGFFAGRQHARLEEFEPAAAAAAG